MHSQNFAIFRHYTVGINNLCLNDLNMKQVETDSALKALTNDSTMMRDEQKRQSVSNQGNEAKWKCQSFSEGGGKKIKTRPGGQRCVFKLLFRLYYLSELVLM